MKKRILTLMLTFTAACGGNSANMSNTTAENPTRVGALLTEYKQSKEAMVAKYIGKTLTVGGVTTTAPIMPKGADDTGILIIGERGGDPFSTMTCWFKQSDNAEFSKIKADQAVILRGVFEDTISTGLASCKIVRAE